MNDPIDYLRPVGWWCPVCGMEWPRYPHTLTHVHQHAAIPRYLPIPEGQRPPAASEVEDAEVGTAAALGRSIYWGPIVNDFRQRRHTYNPTAEEIRFIVTGATE